MALKKWRGGAASVIQITTITFSAYTSGQTYTVTINGKSITYLASASTIANVIEGLVTAWESTVEPEFSEATASSNSGLVLTANTAGIPFVVSASATGGITATVTATRAATGPNHFDNAQNWVGGSLPSAGDDLLFTSGEFDVLYGIESTTNFGDITIDSTFTGAVGLPATNSNGYREYRPRFLKLGDGTSAFAVVIGLGDGRKPTRVLIDANAATVYGSIYGTGTGDNDEAAVVIKNTDATSEIDVYSGLVTIDADSSGALAALRITPADGGGTVDVMVNTTVAAGAVVVAGGSLQLRGSATSLDVSNSGRVTTVLEAACPTVTVADGGIVEWGSSQGITTKANVQNRGTLNLAFNGEEKTVAAADLYAGGALLDPLACASFTSGIAIKGCKLADVTLDVGRNQVISTSPAIQGLHVFDSENADRDLTSLVAVLTHTPDVVRLRYCTAIVFLGDGTKDLDGTGGDFQVQVSIDGALWNGGSDTIGLGPNDRAVLQVNDFLVPAGAEVIVRVLSPNAADTDVDVTAMLVSED